LDSVLQFEFQNPSIDQYLDYKEANKVVEVVEAVAVQVGKEAKEREEKQVHWVVNLEVASLEAQAEVTEEAAMEVAKAVVELELHSEGTVEATEAVSEMDTEEEEYTVKVLMEVAMAERHTN
tara:strand:+ start:1046 stop:1411 length:366 start_codon:yes stop_codon:yes gene_type:complete